MQAIALRPQRAQLTGMLVGVCGLIICMALVPALCIPLGLMLPIFACPLVGIKKRWAPVTVVAAVIAPPLIAFIVGQPTLLALSLLCTCGAPVVVTLTLKPGKAATPAAFVYYLLAYGFSVIVVLASVRGMVGGELAAGISQRVASAVSASPDAGTTLYRMAASGLIDMPTGYDSGSLALWLNPVLVRQMTLSLRLTLEASIRQLLPAAIVQACLLGSVFTTLRVQKLNHAYILVDEKHKERVTLATPPGFSMLRLPPKSNWALAGMAVIGFICLMSDSSWAYQLGLLLYACFQGCFGLLGASVLVGMLSIRKPDSKTTYGVLAAALYVLLPSVPIIIGIMDPLFHFRESARTKKEEEL